jgi:hypothetical protein
MTTPKDKINWYYALLGLILIAGYFYPNNTKVDDSELKTKAITLSRDIEFIPRSRNSASFHRLWTNETSAAFIVKLPGEIAAKWRPLDSLKRGDSLTVKYLSSRENDLWDEASEVPVYYLQKAGKIYFDTPAYNQSKAAYNKRLGWLALIGGSLFILRGLTIINSKTSYILGGIAFVVIVVLRLLNRF